MQFSFQQMVDHQDKILNEELIMMGIAEYSEESYISRQDNLTRTKSSNKRHIDLFAPTHIEKQNNFMKNVRNSSLPDSIHLSPPVDQ